MKRFKFRAKERNGRLVVGEVEAVNEAAAARLIRKRDLVVISITPARNLPIDILGFRERVSGSDVTNFTRQLATMIQAGLPLTEALVILRTQSNGGLAKTASTILSDVEEGQSLSSAMGKHKNVFSKSYIALVKSGEVGGVLEEVLVRLAENMEKQQEFKGKIKTAMIYPVIIVFGMIAVAVIMLIFVIPRLTSLYDQFEAELPFTTRFLVSISDFMVQFWYVVFGVVLIAFWGLKMYRKTKNGRIKTDTYLLRIPIIGGLQRQIVLTELTRTLSLMVGSGVSIIESLTISAAVVSNRVIADALDDVVKLVEKGFPVAFAFSKHPEAFPFILSQMIAVGEETGKMDEVLGKVSHIFEVESDQKLKTLTAAVEPAILMILGVGVAFMVISIIMPIYNLTTQI